MCGAQSSESPRSFLPLAIISHDQRILTGSHSLHITGHMRTQTTHHRVFCEMWSGGSRHGHHHLETELDTRRFSASQTWSQRCVKWPGDWWACLNVNHLSNDFPDLHMNWITNGRNSSPRFRSKIETWAAKRYLIQNDWCVRQCFNRHFSVQCGKARIMSHGWLG